MFYLSDIDAPEDKAFLIELYTRYQQMMYGIAFNILKDRYDAEDSVHEAFLSIIRKDRIAELKKLGPGEIKAYLIVTVKNASLRCYNFRRKNSGENIDDLLSVEGGVSAEDSTFSEYESEKIKEALSKLPPGDFELLYESAVLEHSSADIAERLGIAENAVRQRIFRARKRLKKLLNQEETANDTK